MAAIIDDGPRHWAVDALNRKLGRVAAMSNGMLMLLAVTAIDPGTARIVLAVGAVTLVGYACRPQPSAVPATIVDLAEVEALFMERIDGLETVTDRQAAEVTELVAEIRDQLR
jgi:hypothetical protein